MEQEPDIFDRIAAQASAPLLIDAQPKDELSAHTEQAPEAQNTSDSPTRTPQAVRKALQYVLANGWLESATKPHMFRLIAAQMAQLDVHAQRFVALAPFCVLASAGVGGALLDATPRGGAAGFELFENVLHRRLPPAVGAPYPARSR